MTKTATETPVEKSADEEAQAQADFEAGAAMEDVPRPQTSQQTEGQQPRDDAGRFAPAKPEPKPAAKPADQPEYVQITKQQLERFEAAAKSKDDIDKQLSKAFGTIGDIKKIVQTLQGQTPRGIAVKIPDGAFAAMEKDFPELAQHTRAALEATLKGLEGTGSSTAQVDVAEFDRKVEQSTIKLQFEQLDDEIPNWRKIVGFAPSREKADPNNPFRKWLATKDQTYQDRINLTNSAGVITRAIRRFRSETKAAQAAPAPVPKPDPKALARANRIQGAVRPKGDGGHPPGKSADDEFEAGYRSG